jgi:hypothetical protein
VCSSDLSGGMPTGSVLASTQLSVNPTTTGFAFYDFNSLGALGSYTLSPNTQYALTFYGPSTSASFFSNKAWASDSYAVSGGFTVNHNLFTTDGGANWSDPNQWYGLQISMNGVAAVPEPSTCALLFIGGLPLVTRLRRK